MPEVSAPEQSATSPLEVARQTTSMSGSIQILPTDPDTDVTAQSEHANLPSARDGAIDVMVEE